jgi:hypothetical protein
VPAKKTSKKTAKRKAKPMKAKAKSRSAPEESSPFTKALAKLLRSRKLPVPDGLLEAPPEAYASQPAEVVESMARLNDVLLTERAEKIATFAQRQSERAKQAWNSSPLIQEIRRRGLKVPRTPKRPAGAAFSLKKPLAEWSDDELLAAATDWSRRGS